MDRDIVMVVVAAMCRNEVKNLSTKFSYPDHQVLSLQEPPPNYQNFLHRRGESQTE